MDPLPCWAGCTAKQAAAAAVTVMRIPMSSQIAEFVPRASTQTNSLGPEVFGPSRPSPVTVIMTADARSDRVNGTDGVGPSSEAGATSVRCRDVTSRGWGKWGSVIAADLEGQDLVNLAATCS